jgi:hypothetical protein
MIYINQTNNYFSSQLTEQEKDHDIWRWKSGPDLGQAHKCDGGETD